VAVQALTQQALDQHLANEAFGAGDDNVAHSPLPLRNGNELVIKGKSFGTMPMQARLDATSARAGLKMLGLGKLAFLASLPFRKGGQ